jgi:hypothetical protein
MSIFSFTIDGRAGKYPIGHLPERAVAHALASMLGFLGTPKGLNGRCAR